MCQERLLPLLSLLRAKTGFLRRTTLCQKRQGLMDLAKFARVHDVQEIAPLLLTCEKELAEEIGQMLRTLLLQGIYDPRTRLYDSFKWVPSKTLMTCAEKRHLSLEARIHVWGIASLSTSGYVRQDALKKLALCQHPEAFPYVLLRLNDWVDEVHIEAQDAFLTLLPHMGIKDLLLSFRLLEGLRDTGRRNLEGLYERVMGHIRNPSHRDEVLILLTQSPTKMRHFLCHSLGAQPDILEHAAHNDDVWVRMWAVKHISTHHGDETNLVSFFQDRASCVRLCAFRRVPEQIYGAMRLHFEKALFDPAKGVRHFARVALASLGLGDTSSFYRESLLDHSSYVPYALMGLAETGTQADVQCLMPFLERARGRTKAALLEAFVRWEVADMEDLLLEGITDTNARVRWICGRLVQEKYRYLQPRLRAMVMDASTKIALYALMICVSIGGLEGLEAIFLALLRHDEDLKANAWQCLIHWWKRYYARPWFQGHWHVIASLMELMDKLQSMDLDVPLSAQSIWNSLPDYMVEISQHIDHR